MKEAIFAVNLKAALKVRPFISENSTRWYLQGVYVQALEGGGASCTATDGQRLGIARDADGFCIQPTIVRIPKSIKCPLLFTKTAWLIGIQTAREQGYIAVILADHDATAKEAADAAIARPDLCYMMAGNAFIDGTYPDIGKVVPTLTGDAPIAAFNRKLLRGFGRHMTLSSNGAEEPQIVRGDDPNFFGVIMPVRGVSSGVPDWFERPEVLATQAEGSTSTTKAA